MVPCIKGKRLLICRTIGAMLVFALIPFSLLGQTPEFRPIQVVPAFPAITQFPVKNVREAGGSLNPTELVLGVTVGKESRAYPINMLTGPQREILNDSLGGKAIAATW